MIQLFDTASRSVRPLELREPPKVSMYVCGPTVYGPPHLGHGRFALVFDILRRWLIWSGFEVRYVSNITDIDDKIIALSLAEERPSSEVAEQWEKVWWDVMDAIGVMRPDADPHATGYVDEMVDSIGRLVDADAAYVTSDGVYMAVETVDDYGLLANQSLAEMVAGGGDREVLGGEKRNPADFALWKFAKEDEPSWPSPWGDGRPGWHTECVVMALDLLGGGFDIHGGGLDLAFPHHENERAQSVALGSEFARHWVHNGFVEVGGEKMSKSLGNFTTLTDLIAQHDQRSYRLLVLQAHYRSPVEVTASSVANAEAALQRLDNFADRVAALSGQDEAAESAPSKQTAGPELVENFRRHMDNDLDTPSAMAAVFSAVTEVNRLLDSGDTASGSALAESVLDVLSAVGLEVGRTESEVPPEVLAKCSERDAARAGKDWAAADSIREELAADGWLVEDTPEGTKVRKP